MKTTDRGDRGDVAITHIKEEEKSGRNQGTPKKMEKGRNDSAPADKGHMRLSDEPLRSEGVYSGLEKRERHSEHYYREKVTDERKAPVQRRKSDYYKGGAELEYNAGIAELNFKDLDSWTPDLLFEGIKGVSFDHAIPKPDSPHEGIKGESVDHAVPNPDSPHEDIKGVSVDHTVPNRKMLRGSNWNLTVELMGFNVDKMLKEKKTPITLELIIGGSTGTKLSELPNAAKEAADKIAELDEYGGKICVFEFDDQVFQTVADNIIKHYRSHAERKMRIIETSYPSLYHAYKLETYDLDNQSQDADDLKSVKTRIEPHQMGEDEAETPEVNLPKAAQISPVPTLPTSSSSPTSKSLPSEPLSPSLESPSSESPPSKSLPPPPPPPLPTVLEGDRRSGDIRDDQQDQQEVQHILTLIGEDLKKKKAAEERKKTNKFSMTSTVALPQMGLLGADWGLQVTLGIPVAEIPGVIENLSMKISKEGLFSNTGGIKTVSKEELENRLGQKPELLGKIRGMPGGNSCLDGLSKIISAYRRSIGNVASSGPKHDMQLVNKNPLHQVILSVKGLEEEEKRMLLDVCVDMIVSDHIADVWNWEGASLKVSEWSEKIKADPPIDLVAIYDGAYRHGQIGQLSSLNENEEGAPQIPVFEFRDLSSIKIRMLADLFQTLADNCDREDERVTGIEQN